MSACSQWSRLGNGNVRVGVVTSHLSERNWAQWCPPCREESPYLRQFQKASKGKVFMLGIDYNDPRPELAVEFAGLVGWKYPQLADPERRLSTKMSVPGLPTTLFVDADGKVVAARPLTYVQASELLVEDGELYIKTANGNVVPFSDVKSVRQPAA